MQQPLRRGRHEQVQLSATGMRLAEFSVDQVLVKDLRPVPAVLRGRPTLIRLSA